MEAILKIVSSFILVATALVLTGCPMRRGGRRLVYVPAPPAASGKEAAGQGNVLVIPAPAPPAAPAEAAPKHDEAAAPVVLEKPVRRRHVAHDEPTAGTNPPPAADAASAAAAPATAAGPPQLAPARTAQQQVELRRQIGQLRQGIRKRIEGLNHKPLSGADREAVKDAQLFLSQADDATRQGDLQQALNLSQKADLLIAAVEKRY